MAELELSYVCVICRRELPCIQGQPLPTGSWICKDTTLCFQMVQAGIPADALPPEDDDPPEYDRELHGG